MSGSGPPQDPNPARTSAAPPGGAPAASVAAGRRPPRRPRLRRRLLLLALSAALFLAGLEAALRLLPPGWINPRLGNFVYSRYGTFPGGIYFEEPATGVNFMIPGLDAAMYWNGYVWRHRADARGFRNPAGIPTGLVLYGDSLIYGHGVEQEDTAAHLLRARHGRPAYNLARQGDCLYQHYVLARLELDRLRPREAVLFVFMNDFDDLTAYRSTAELADPPEIDRFDYAAIRRRVETLGRDPGARQPLLHRVVFGSRALRLLLGLSGQSPIGLIAAPAPAPPPLPPSLAAILDDHRWQPAAGYYRRILPELAREHRERGVRLSVVLLPIGLGEGADAEAAILRVNRFLKNRCRVSGLPYHAAGPAFADCPDCFLPADGHLSPEGHRRLAGWLDRSVLAPAPGLARSRPAVLPSAPR